MVDEEAHAGPARRPGIGGPREPGIGGVHRLQQLALEAPSIDVFADGTAAQKLDERAAEGGGRT